MANTRARSPIENYFISVCALRHGTPDLKAKILDGLKALLSLTANEMLGARIQGALDEFG